MIAVNDMIGESKYRFLTWLFLTIITCYLYHIYHEFRKSKDISEASGQANSNDPMVSIILTVFGLGIVADATQQAAINRYYGSESL